MHAYQIVTLAAMALIILLFLIPVAERWVSALVGLVGVICLLAGDIIVHRPAWILLVDSIFVAIFIVFLEITMPRRR